MSAAETLSSAVRADAPPAISLQKVNKWFGSLHVLRDVSLDVALGERVVVCGPSGSGKSTMIRCINRLETHQEGKIIVDGTELTDDLRARDVQTLTMFALHVPAALFAADNDGMRDAATRACLDSLNSVLAEPIEDCLLLDANGQPCLEARTPLDLERDVALPAGNIFHRPLQWPWAPDASGVGTWGVETEHPRVLLAGAGARRGGGVSGIAGRNAAMAVLRG